MGSAQAQTAPGAPKVTNASAVPADTMLVEAACGQCRLGLPSKGCDLAVRVAGRAYFVSGTGIDSHGDAHAKDGFCNAIRQARVQGKVVDNKFNATYFQLQPGPTAAAPKPKP
ncbi:hypothetical protein GCM10027511_31490 [Hymenobacter humi]